MACAMLLHITACNPRSGGAPEREAATVARADAPDDSLVATAPGGAEIWCTLAREATAADGTSCVDRAIEIRRGDKRIQVPLLYTGHVPEVVNDSTIRARLSNQCVPGYAYLVDLQTGRPVRER
jgi:hypothetical protein